MYCRKERKIIIKAWAAAHTYRRALRAGRLNSGRNIKEKMRKVLAGILVLCVGAFALTGCSKNKTAEAGVDSVDTVIKIGVFEPFTGNDSAEGKKEALGIEFANTQLHTVDLNGETYTIELRQSDNASSAAASATAAYDLIDDGCDIVIGSYGADVSIAAAATFGKAGIAVIGASCDDHQVTESNGNYYCVCYHEAYEGAVMAAYASRQYSASTAYMLMKNGDALSETLGSSFKEAFLASGGTVLEGHYQQGNTDFSDYLDVAANGGANVLFAPIPVADADLFLSQASTRDALIPILSGSHWNDDEILRSARGTALSVSIPDSFSEDIGTEAGSGFVSAFKEWLNANPDKLADNGGSDDVSMLSALGYDAYMMAVEAIKNAGSAEPAEILTVLAGTSFDGVTGGVAFDATGGAVRDGACVLQADTSDGSWSFVTYQKAG